MSDNSVLKLSDLIGDGKLFYPPDDDEKIEAYLPTTYERNHASNLVALENGDLLCTWFAGSREGMPDIKIVMSRLANDADSWSKPIQLSQDADRSEQNPVLFPTPGGDLWLLHTAQETRGCSPEAWHKKVDQGKEKGAFIMQETSEIRRRVSDDGGHSWSKTETLFGKPGSFCRQPMVVLSNGDWLFPMYYSQKSDPNELLGKDYSVVMISENQGESWSEYRIPGSEGRVHPSVMELKEGELVAFFRSRAADRIYLSKSSDYGRSWSKPKRTDLPNNNSSIQATKLLDGDLALIFNYNCSGNEDPNRTVWPGKRYPVTVAISVNGGESWPYIRHVETGDDFFGSKNKDLNRRYSYPSILQTSDGLIHMTYSYASRKCIKYVRTTKEWITGERKAT